MCNIAFTLVTGTESVWYWIIFTVKFIFDSLILSPKNGQIFLIVGLSTGDLKVARRSFTEKKKLMKV